MLPVIWMMMMNVGCGASCRQLWRCSHPQVQREIFPKSFTAGEITKRLARGCNGYRVKRRKDENVRKELLIFAGGVVVGAGVMALWPVFSNTSKPNAVNSTRRDERLAIKTKKTSSAHVKKASSRDVAVQSDDPAPVTDGNRLPQNTVSETTPTPPLAVPYLDTRLQTALRTFQTTSDKIDRSVLVSEVVKLVDAAVPKPQIAVALGTMLQQENSVEVKTAILDELGNLDDPAAFDQIIQGLGQNQPQEVRIEAIDALDSLGDKRALPLLQRLLSDHDAEIREAAQNAIDSLNDQ
jgi:hypothetical protein